MPPKIVSKDVHEKWNNAYQVDLDLRPTEYGAFDSVKLAACRFYEVYGREEYTDEAANEEIVLPILTPEDIIERKHRKKTTKTQHWTKFCVDNIQKQPAKKWAAYNFVG